MEKIIIEHCDCTDCNGTRQTGTCVYQTINYIFLDEEKDEKLLSPTMRKRKNSNTKIENK